MIPLCIISTTYGYIVYDVTCRKNNIGTPKDVSVRRENRKVTSLLLVVTVTFAVCSLPFQIISLVKVCYFISELTLCTTSGPGYLLGTHRGGPKLGSSPPMISVQGSGCFFIANNHNCISMHISGRGSGTFKIIQNLKNRP